MSPTLKLVLVGVLVVLALFALGRFLRWAGKRGWVYNKYNPRPRHAGSLGILERIYQPSIEHVIEFEVSDRTDAEQDEAGEPPGEPDSDSKPDDDT